MTRIKNLFNTSKKVLLSRSDKRDYGIFMETIDENTEKLFDKQLDAKGCFSYKTSDGMILLNSSVYLYGEIDINNKKDIKYLNKFKNIILNPYDYSNWYYTSFNYETGNISYDEERNAWLGINFIADVIKWFKYCYCILGKPKRIIIYKQPIVRKLDG